MKLRIFLLGLMIPLLSQFAAGQAIEQLKTNYERETVYWKGGKILKDGRKLKLKYFKAELLKYQDSNFELQEYRRYENKAWIWYGVSLAGLIYVGSTNDQNLGLPALGVSLGALIPFLIFKNKANNSLHKSIWYYNRDVTFSPYPGF